MTSTNSLKFVCHSYYMLFGMLGYGMAPALSRSIEESQGLSHTQMGMILSTTAATYSVFTLGGGAVFDRWGPKPLFSGGLLLCALTALAVWFSSSLPVFAVTFILFCSASALGNVGVNPLVGNLYREARGRGMNLLHGFQTFGRLLSPLILIGVVRFTEGWKAIFLVSALLHGLFIPLFLWNLRGVRAVSFHAVRSPARPAAPLRMLRDYHLWVGVLGFFFTAGYEYTILYWLPNCLETERGYSRNSALISLSFLFIGYTLIRLMLGMGLWGKRPRVLLTLFLVNVASLWLILHWRNAYASYFLHVVIGMTMGAFWPTLAGIIYDYAPTAHGKLTSVFVVLTQAGAVVFLSLAGWVGDVIHLRASLALAPCSAAIFLAIYIWFYLHSRRARRTNDDAVSASAVAEA